MILVVAVLAVLMIPPLRAEVDWLGASSADTRAAYAGYLARWPDGQHGGEAARREDERAWAAAINADTDSDLETYLTDFPRGAHTGQALDRLDELAWTTATQAASVDSHEQYLRRQPDGKYREQARAAVEELRWQAALAENTLEPLLAHLAAYPGGRFESAARERIDNIRWEEAERVATKEAFARYLTEQPEGTHTTRATEKIDELDWQTAASTNTLAAYIAYLRAYASGKYKDMANQSIAALPAPIPGARYSGTTESRGLISFTISADGTTISQLSLPAPANQGTCQPLVLLASVDLREVSIPVVNRAFSYAGRSFQIPAPSTPTGGVSRPTTVQTPDVKGTFLDGQVAGTLAFTVPGHPACGAPEVPWTASPG